MTIRSMYAKQQEADAAVTGDLASQIHSARAPPDVAAHRIVRPDTDNIPSLAATTCAIEKFLSGVMTVPWRCPVSGMEEASRLSQSRRILRASDLRPAQGRRLQPQHQ